MVEFEAKTENDILLDFFKNWNEIAAKTENETLFENLIEIGMNLRLRQKKILPRNRFVEFN